LVDGGKDMIHGFLKSCTQLAHWGLWKPWPGAGFRIVSG
jgi:hypothetical protein